VIKERQQELNRYGALHVWCVHGLAVVLLQLILKSVRLALLCRLLVEEQSLMRVRAEQESLLSKLADASSYGSS